MTVFCYFGQPRWPKTNLKVQCGTFGDFKEKKTATSSGYMWDCSTLSILSWLNAPLVSRRELNNMGIWYRMGNVPRAQDSTFTPTTNNIQNVNSSSNSVPLPAASMPKYVQPESGGGWLTDGWRRTASPPQPFRTNDVKANTDLWHLWSRSVCTNYIYP